MSTRSSLPFLDKSDPETWKALNGLALKVAAAAEAAGLEREADAVTLLPDAEERRGRLAAARDLLGDQPFTAVEWAAITMNAYNRVSILSEHPVRRREEP